MVAGEPGVFVLPWSNTEIEGLRGGPVARLEIGATWSWSGEALPLSFASPAAVRDCPESFLRYAARAVPRLLGDAMPRGTVAPGAPAFDRGFTLSDGRRRYDVWLMAFPEIARPLLVFVGRLPPRSTRLRVVGLSGAGAAASAVNRMTEEPTGVICFTAGTFLDTPEGPRRVEDLVEGDRVATKDNGAQDILWIGSRRMSGARLHAMPELRPIRLRNGAIDGAVPSLDLVVSPRHRIVLAGDIARALFGTPEVLVTARDLVDDRGILVDRAAADVTYVHILLPRHEIVRANGVETESFHPASTDLETVTADQRQRLLAIVPGIDADPLSYGESARRILSAEDAAIFGGEAAPRH